MNRYFESLIENKNYDFIAFLLIERIINLNYVVEELADKNVLMKEIIKSILKTRTYSFIKADLIYEIACGVKDAPIEELTKAVIETGDTDRIYKFARDVKDAPIEELAKAVIKKGKAEYIYHFARDVKNAPIEELTKAIIETGDGRHIYYFARDIKDAPIEELAKAVIETGDGRHIYEFARDVKDAPIEELAIGIMLTNDSSYIHRFSCDFKNVSVRKLAKLVIETGDGRNIYEFARNVKDAPIEELAKAVIETDDAECIYEFACNVKDAPIEELVKAIIKTGDTNRIIGLMKNNNLNLDFNKLLPIILELNDTKIIQGLLKEYEKDWKNLTILHKMENGMQIKEIQNKIENIINLLLINKKDVSILIENISFRDLQIFIDDILRRSKMKNLENYKSLLFSELQTLLEKKDLIEIEKRKEEFQALFLNPVKEDQEVNNLTRTKVVSEIKR